jgi:diadenosine tetraphosphate (Ap4A) HIT family hydrolase
MDCPFCDKEALHPIFEGRYWKVVINPDQKHLGRHMIILNRHSENVFDLSKKEMDEAWKLAKQSTEALDRIYHPDMYNYAFLMNGVRHVHMHVYPRYKDERTVDGVTFKDERYGKNMGIQEKMEVDQKTFEKITTDFEKEMRT